MFFLTLVGAALILSACTVTNAPAPTSPSGFPQLQESNQSVEDPDEYYFPQSLHVAATDRYALLLGALGACKVITVRMYSHHVSNPWGSFDHNDLSAH